MREQPVSYRAIFDAVNDAILVMALEGDRIIDANRPVSEMFGYPREQVLTMRTADLGSGIHPYTAEVLLRHRHKAALGEPQLFEWQGKRADGSLFWVEITLKLATLEGQERLLGVFRDITKRKHAEADVHRLAAFPTASPYPVLECDASGFPIYLNPSTQHLIDSLEVDLTDLLPSTHAEIVQACLADGAPSTDVEVKVADRILAWTYQPVTALSVVHLYALDLTDVRRAEARLQQNAVQDVLTGLPNRALLMDRLERNLELVQRHSDYHFALLFLDLDRFKRVNDSLGHEGGDELLRQVTHRINGCVKQADTVARTGGDEFVVLLEDLTTPGNVTRIAERIQAELARTFFAAGREVHISASMGIVLSQAEAMDPARMIQSAETAMYRAKAEGKGRYTVFDAAQHARAAEQLQLEMDFHAALERREFVNYYQPIVAIRTRQIIGFEALVRWNHPQRGVLSPFAFIPMAEETGLVEDMAEQVLESACEQLRIWRRGGYPHLQGSVNISGVQFRREDLAERILTTVVRTGLDPRALKVEVTESVAAGDTEYTIATLQRLRDLGIGVMIDDFGTGYSSLGYLKRFPLDYLKIDRTFVKDVTTDTDSAAIVTTIILMAHAMGFEVVAEGVETAEQLAFLAAHNCNLIQGFYFSKPVPAAEFERLLARGFDFESN